MPKDLSRMAQRFLSELSSSLAFESLDELIQLLEEKVDPDPIEIKLIESLYNFQEKLKILETNVRTYIKRSRENLLGEKLQSLYDETSYNGSCSIFKD